MLFQRAGLLSKGDFTLENYLNIADALCHSQLEVAPIFECVKVFVRINEHGDFVYARHRHDLGNSNIDCHQIVGRIKNDKRQHAVLDALCEVEEKCYATWPFCQGSSTWVLLEILHPDIRLASAGNKPTIIFRTANRISSKGVLSETTLTKSLFGQFSAMLEEVDSHYSFAFNPTIRLNNISGSGVYTKFLNGHEVTVSLAGESKTKLSELQHQVREDYESRLSDLFAAVLDRNFSLEAEKNPGFMFMLNEQLFKVQGKAFEEERKKASEQSRSSKNMPPPPFGFRR